jgi:OCT family organic cation transporter-like MFS transporter 4/5
MRATAQALFMVGVLVGSKVFGILSDIYGRKFSFFLSVVLQEKIAVFEPSIVSL